MMFLPIGVANLTTTSTNFRAFMAHQLEVDSLMLITANAKMKYWPFWILSRFSKSLATSDATEFVDKNVMFMGASKPCAAHTSTIPLTNSLNGPQTNG